MATQINILEKLSENFEELKEDIQKIHNEIEEHYKTNQILEDKINELKENQTELLSVIEKKEFQD